MIREKFVYENEKKEQIEFSALSDFFLINITGIAGINNIITSCNNDDGSIFISSHLNNRNIVIQGKLKKENRAFNRERLIKVLNPKLSGKLIYHNGINDKVKYIDCRVEKSPDPIKDAVSTFQISLLCNNPYWKNYNETKKNIALWKGDFHFPLIIPKTTGIMMGHREPSLIVNVNNDGDARTGMVIEFKARGTLSNPSLFNVNTREFLKINKSMVAGEKIIVNTNFGKKKILNVRNGIETDILNYLDIVGGGDTFLQLDLGDNLFRYNADTNLDNLEVTIYFSPQYVGV